MWVYTGNSDNYGALRGHLPGRLKALLKVRVPGRSDQRLALVRMAKPEFSGRPDDAHGLVSVLQQPPEDAHKDWVVNIRSITAMAHLVQDATHRRRWFVNSRIDLWTFNQIY